MCSIHIFVERFEILRPKAVREHKWEGETFLDLAYADDLHILYKKS